MSTPTLRSRIEEDHLTCTVCFQPFTQPKALPCLHTFCEQCLRDYVASRGFEPAGEFPCPICRNSVRIPEGGIGQFPDNHMVRSLSDTMDQAKTRPTPKPRRSLQPQPNAKADEAMASSMGAPPPYTPTPLSEGGAASSAPPPGGHYGGGPPPQEYHPPPAQGYHQHPPPQGYHHPPPPQGYHHPPPPQGYHHPSPPQDYNSPPPQAQGYNPPSVGYSPPPSGYVKYVSPPSSGYVNPPQQGYDNPPPYSPPQLNYPNPYTPVAGIGASPVGVPGVNPSIPTTSRGPQTAPVLYPAIPPPPPSESGSDGPCSQGLQLRFGKKGASITDFNKPFGLAVSDECDFVVTDMAGNRIFIFDHRGQPKKAFSCEGRIKNVAVNSKNEIVVVVNKPGVALRCFDMAGKCLAEHGKFITHEEPHGLSLFSNGGGVITGTQNHSVYVLTDQYKQSTKFGRKGTGDGYFQSPAFVATDSKNHIVVSDNVNHNVQVFNSQGKFKVRFGGKGSGPGQLCQPAGLTTTADDCIIVADSGNCRVEMFSARGVHVRTIVSGTEKLGEEVRPVNVAMTPRGNVAVLLRGNYFAEVRVYNPYASSSSSTVPSGLDPTSVKDSATWYLVN